MKGVAVECNVQDWIAGSQLTVVVLAKMQDASAVVYSREDGLRAERTRRTTRMMRT